MKSSCISHPANERLVIIRQWQVDFCEGNHCAAALLSYFEYWHNWKLNTDEYNKHSNDVAEMHNDSRIFSEDILQYHTLQEISDGISNLYGVKTILEGIKLLEAKAVLSTHSNPNPRYHYDKTKFFRFYPEICNEWLKNRDKSGYCKNTTSIKQKEKADVAKLPDREGENASLSGKNALAITEINNKDKQNQSMNARDEIFNGSEKKSDSEQKAITGIRSIVVALVTAGMPEKRFNYPDTVKTIQNLILAGATHDDFIEAYTKAVRATQDENFGMNYLSKVVEDVMAKKRQKTTAQNLPEEGSKENTQPHYESDYSQALDWMGDLLD